MLHPFERAGLASIDDLEHPAAVYLFQELESAQSAFLSHESRFRGSDYIWPRDPLHTWSRCWEYPYVLHQIRRWRAGQGAERPKVIDLGCGVTFFPFAVAREGCQVTGVDLDPVAKRDLENAAKVVDAGAGVVDARLTDGTRLPFEDGSVDVVYSISVLEHIEDPVPVLHEAARVLRPGGLFLLTLDVDLAGNYDLSPRKFARVMEALDKLFDRAAPERTIHPLRILDSRSGPYPLTVPEDRFAGLVRPVKELVKAALGREAYSPLHLACWGGSLVKRT